MDGTSVFNDVRGVKTLRKLLPQRKKLEKYFLAFLSVFTNPTFIAVCRVCKSPNLRRVRSTGGDMTGHLGWLPVMYECLDCGWRGRLENLCNKLKDELERSCYHS